MRLFIALAILCCLFSSNGYAYALQVLPDTLMGQSQLVKQLRTEACEQLLSRQKNTPFSTLNATQAQQLFEETLSATIEKRVSSIKQVAARSKIAGAYEQLRANLPTAVAIQLVKTCQPAATLYNQFSNSLPTAAEQMLIKSWGSELCSRLTALKDNGSFKGKTPTERMELFRREFMTSVNTHGPQIMKVYGPAGNSPQAVDRLSQLVSQQIQEQCTSLLYLLNQAD
ncbi:hypothetical protein [Hymenobacter seoulensis]